MIKKKIDILLPTYNGEKYLAAQIDSILSQSYKEFRLLIRDDGSTDNTCAIIEEFCKRDERVVLMKDDFGNVGLVRNVELLLRYSDSDLLFFSDQDDVWLPQKIDVFIKSYKNDDVARLVHSNCFLTDENLNITGRFLNDKIAKNLNPGNSFFHYFVQGASAMMNKELKKKLIPFPSEVYIHDRYFHLMCEIFGERTYISAPTMLYRQHQNNLIGNSGILQKIKNIAKNKYFYLQKDKILFRSLAKKYPKNEILALYLKITDTKTTRIDKLNLLKKNKVTMRLKEKILLILNN